MDDAMISPKDGFEFDPFPAIKAKALKDFFALPELANRTIEGGWELLFRNQLLSGLRKFDVVEGGEFRCDREALVARGKVADIRILDASHNADSRIGNQPRAIFEIKHNFATQPEVFRELKGAMTKWKLWRKKRSCEFHYIQIITDISFLSGKECKGCCIFPSNNKSRKGEVCKGFCRTACADLLKYKVQPDKQMRGIRMKAIRKHFDLLQKCVDPKLHSDLRKRCEHGEPKVGIRFKKFSVVSSKYFLRDIAYKADVYVFLVSQRAVTKRAADGILFEDKKFPKQRQVGLLNFSKGANAREFLNACAELR